MKDSNFDFCRLFGGEQGEECGEMMHGKVDGQKF